MAKHRKTAEAERAVVRFFDQLPTRVFKPAQLAGILSQNAARWQLPYRLQVTTSFIEFLTEQNFER
jgi:hypothetical protein